MIFGPVIECGSMQTPLAWVRNRIRDSTPVKMDLTRPHSNFIMLID